MTIYMWKFNSIPDPKAVERFIDAQIPLFSRNVKYIHGADGKPIVDLMRVEHNCGAVNLEFQLNGAKGHRGDVFCFPGYYPGDLDDEGNFLFNRCDTRRHFYGKIVEVILSRAQKVFDMEITTSVKTNGNSIKPCEHGSQVVLDPSFLLRHALYMPDGETVIKTNMTLGQAIEAIAFAHVKARTPHLAGKCNVAKIEFEDGKFIVSFADSPDNLIF